MTNRKLYTLLMLHVNKKVLLGFKKRGFGKNKWNLFGGKVEENEQIIDAAVREMKEESGLNINPDDIFQRGILNFNFVGDPISMEVHVFYGNKFEGKLEESVEMRPKWFNEDEIPYDLMWADDRIWYPLGLSGKKIRADFQFEKDNLLQHSLEFVDEF